MMLLILTIAIVVIAGIAFYNSYENNEIIGTVSLGVIVVFVAVLVLEVCLICSAIFPAPGLKVQFSQRYESLTYQLENNLYDNDNEVGKKQLYDEIRQWNEDVAYGKKMQDDIWVGIFYPHIYDEFELIELE